MLQIATVASDTLELLKTLMRDEKLSGFILAGGTNLALRLGHRKSVDLDLFPYKSFDGHKLQQYLTEKYHFEPEFVREHDTVKGLINGVKVDFVAHIYPPLNEPVVEEGIRLYSLNDIAAMKLVAISDSGKRLKDFVDMAYLSTKMSLNKMLSSYAGKYKNANPMHALRGLSYFGDINFNAEIELTRGKFEWRKIEKRIGEMIKYENKTFETFPI
ncbi:MAG: nucleotidyl transferase AbiEii/AbiGii toxin family protein [Dysgonamonadaceae bacterium]|jgi:hypothetical protein|nr:nucleotidyl transferase AbiEii/AbiGii toxin family protein [Dysgonamonadaceae bacterium]